MIKRFKKPILGLYILRLNNMKRFKFASLFLVALSCVCPVVAEVTSPTTTGEVQFSASFVEYTCDVEFENELGDVTESELTINLNYWSSNYFKTQTTTTPVNFKINFSECNPELNSVVVAFSSDSPEFNANLVKVTSTPNENLIGIGIYKASDTTQTYLANNSTEEISISFETDDSTNKKVGSETFSAQYVVQGNDVTLTQGKAAGVAYINVHYY